MTSWFDTQSDLKAAWNTCGDGAEMVEYAAKLGIDVKPALCECLLVAADKKDQTLTKAIIALQSNSSSLDQIKENLTEQLHNKDYAIRTLAFALTLVPTKPKAVIVYISATTHVIDKKGAVPTDPNARENSLAASARIVKKHITYEMIERASLSK